MASAFLEAHGVPNGTPGAIDSFGLIGALHNYLKYEEVEELKEPYPLCNNDNDYIDRTLQLFQDKGIVVVKKPSVHILNREYDYEQGDFLKNTTFKVKALLFCHTAWSDTQPKFRADTTGQSELALDPKVWNERMIGSEAWLAVNITSDKKALPTRLVAQEPFAFVLREKFLSFAGRNKYLDLVVRRGWAPGAHLIPEGAQISVPA